MRNESKYYSDLAIPPGEYLAEVIAELGMSKDELARRMARPAAKLSAIFSGKKVITPATALQLEKVVSVPADIWIGLENEYRLAIAKQKEQSEIDHLKAETHFITKFQYSSLAKLDYVEKKTHALDKVRQLHQYFGVTSLNNIATLKRYQPAYRQSATGRYKSSPEALAAWLRIGELTAQKTVCPAFNKKKLEEQMSLFLELTNKSPEEFIDNLKSRFLSAGVIMVLCPHFPRTYVNGATFWIGSDKAVLMLTIRGSWADIFWFSLFHELGHILLHSKKEIFIEEDNNSSRSESELAADNFASNYLIDPNKYRRFKNANAFYKTDIIQFAAELGIDPGIVVGRLQHEEVIEKKWHNDLRRRYVWH